MNPTSIHVDLRDFCLCGGDSHEGTYSLELAPVVLGGQKYQVLVPDGVVLVVDCVAGGYLVGVSLSATLYGPCARCLKESVVQIKAEEQEFVPTSKEGWEESDLSPFIEETDVDVSGLAREAVVLAVPEQILCLEGCKGLCPDCGGDLNETVCECSLQKKDERWSALKDIKFED